MVEAHLRAPPGLRGGATSSMRQWRVFPPEGGLWKGSFSDRVYFEPLIISLKLAL